MFVGKPGQSYSAVAGRGYDYDSRGVSSGGRRPSISRQSGSEIPANCVSKVSASVNFTERRQTANDRSVVASLTWLAPAGIHQDNLGSKLNGRRKNTDKWPEKSMK
jgi:hypothetical protein